QKGRCQNNNAYGDKVPERFMLQFHNDLQPCKSDTSVYHTLYVRSNGMGIVAEVYFVIKIIRTLHL
ncbi:hypothetical protein NMW39_27150, partial [Escherichia coli]